MQAILRRVRGTIRKAVPGAEEVISYQIPAYKLQGRRRDLFRGLEGALFALSGERTHGEGVQSRTCAVQVSKGTIRFPLSEPVPVKLIEGVAKFRARKPPNG